MLKQSKCFYLAVSLSVLLHGLIIMGVSFKPDIKKWMHDKMPPLEVVIVTPSASPPPPDATLLAQSASDRDSAVAEQAQQKTQLAQATPKADKKTLVKLNQLSQRVEQVETQSQAKQQQVKALESQAQHLLNQLQSPAVVSNSPSSVAKPAEPVAGQRQLNLNVAELIANQDDISHAESQIAKQQEDYQRRPRRKSVGVRSQEYKFAIYVEAWRQKVERIGNLNYPSAAREQKLYGNLQMTVYIKADGSLEKVEIRRSSGHRVLDDAARRIVELAAPYAPFPEDIRKEVDILDITRTWTFTKEESFNGGE